MEALSSLETVGDGPPVVAVPRWHEPQSLMAPRWLPGTQVDRDPGCERFGFFEPDDSSTHQGVLEQVLGLVFWTKRAAGPNSYDHHLFAVYRRRELSDGLLATSLDRVCPLRKLQLHIEILWASGTPEVGTNCTHADGSIDGDQAGADQLGELLPGEMRNERPADWFRSSDSQGSANESDL